MNWDQAAVVAVLAGALVLFAWDHWRYDVVAILALVSLAVLGIVPAAEAFSGFGHPAVVTVAAVLVLSRSLESSGVVDLIAGRLTDIGARPVLVIFALTAIVAVLSGFMNNVGALVLMLPIALQVSTRNGISPSLVLMPLGFGSILGGLTTLIGTPPNIIVSSYRETAAGSPFQIFDFSPVGIVVVIAGVAVLTLASRALIKPRGPATGGDALSQLDPYITEIKIPEGSPFVGRRLGDFEKLGHGDCAVVSIVRDERLSLNPSRHRLLKQDDVLVVEADPETLQGIIDEPGLELVGERQFETEQLISSDIALTEAVVMPGSRLVRRTARSLRLNMRFGVNLLAISRQGENIRGRLGRQTFRSGDVALLQGDAGQMPEILRQLGCVPVTEDRFRAERKLAIGPIGVFVSALAVGAAGLVPVQIALVAAAIVIVLLGYLSLREVYESIDWTVIVLLGALVPVGRSLETTGVTTLIAGGLLEAAAGADPIVVIPLLMICAMALSNVVNNAATAILMAPIAVGMATALGLSVDPFLMAVAVGSSCAFLTPIGHQSNILVMGPGRYRFGDYWRLGLPVSIAVVVVGAPAIALVWPF